MGLTVQPTPDEARIASFLAEDGGFPNDDIFISFLSRARNAGTRIASHDPDSVGSPTFDQFVADVIHLRHRLRKELSGYLDSHGILKSAVPVCVFSAANYEFSVAALVILALGGLVVPLRESQGCEPSIRKKCHSRNLISNGCKPRICLTHPAKSARQVPFDKQEMLRSS